MSVTYVVGLVWSSSARLAVLTTGPTALYATDVPELHAIHEPTPCTRQRCATPFKQRPAATAIFRDRGGSESRHARDARQPP